MNNEQMLNAVCQPAFSHNNNPAGTATETCACHSRRAFLADLGMGFTGLALGAMLADDGVTRASETAALPAPAASGPLAGIIGPHLPAKAKSVIWIFLSGGYSHLETFDPKPEAPVPGSRVSCG